MSGSSHCNSTRKPPHLVLWNNCPTLLYLRLLITLTFSQQLRLRNELRAATSCYYHSRYPHSTTPSCLFSSSSERSKDWELWTCSIFQPSLLSNTESVLKVSCKHRKYIFRIFLICFRVFHMLLKTRWKWHILFLCWRCLTLCLFCRCTVLYFGHCLDKAQWSKRAVHGISVWNCIKWFSSHDKNPKQPQGQFWKCVLFQKNTKHKCNWILATIGIIDIVIAFQI